WSRGHRRGRHAEAHAPSAGPRRAERRHRARIPRRARGAGPQCAEHAGARPRVARDACRPLRVHRVARGPRRARRAEPLAAAPAEEALALSPDGIFLSSGPGDPAAVTYAVKTIRDLLGKRPLFGICLGHQLLALALGGNTYKLKFGHRGLNQPVKDLKTGRV